MMETEPKIYLASCCGNSFILVDDRLSALSREQKTEIAIRLLKEFDRDSALFILPSTVADVQMEIFERDGSQSDTCGNGMMLIAHFLEITEGNIETLGGIFKVTCTAEVVAVTMGVRSVKVSSFEHDHSFLYVQSGEPHLVHVVDDIDSVDLTKIGEAYQPYFLHGINVNILERVSKSTYRIRTYERGVFNITQSCGTGSLSSFTATSFINGESHAGVVEFKSTGGSHWVSREGEKLKLQTLRSFCVINPLHNITHNGVQPNHEYRDVHR